MTATVYSIVSVTFYFNDRRVGTNVSKPCSRFSYPVLRTLTHVSTHCDVSTLVKSRQFAEAQHWTWTNQQPLKFCYFKQIISLHHISKLRLS